MSALERAEEDVERGDYGLARQRLTSYLAAKGYNPEVLTRIGRLCHDMHDVYQAGRYWLTSTAEGDQVEEAISWFMKRSGTDPAGIASRLPRMVRLESMDDYPEAVQERLRRLGLEEAIAVAARAAGKPAKTPWGERAAIAGCLLVVVLAVAVFLIGLGTIVSWMFPD
jgi:hypothetical protein